ncbi:hypothetical protein FQN57_001604 [Myotisia sp. PD_48]|nr:hypothetical protein FQN57_001604 [Myotisia sp. PD_48]
MSGRPGINQKRFSHDRFQVLPDSNMTKPHDATIDIPLTSVNGQSHAGARKGDTADPGYFPAPTPTHGNSPNEKHGMFHGRRRANSISDKALKAPGDGTVTQMGKFYKKIMNFSVVTRYFIYVLPLALLIAIPIVIGATAAPHARIGGVKIVWFFTWVEVVWLSLWVSKVIAHYIPYVFQFLCGIVSSGTRKYALILRALEIPFSLVGWSVTSLATFIPLMTRNPDKRGSGDVGIKDWQNVVKNILFAAFISSLILAAEKVLVQLISISYHRKQFDMKIQESKKNVHLISLLYAASRKMFPQHCPEFEEEDSIIDDSIIGIKKKNHRRTGSASPMRLIQNVGQNVGRVGDKIFGAVGHVAHEITGKRVFDGSSDHSVVILALEKRKSSEALARRLWMSFVLQGREALYLEDFYDVFGPERRAEAEQCFSSLDRDDNGDISLEEMVLTVTEFGRARQSISKSMHDVDQAIHVLDNLLCTVVFILVIMVFVAFLNKGFGTTLAAGATALLSLSFVFAVTAQEVLGSCIFLFVKHPFDVGDRVDINGSRLIVERISLLFTVFRGVMDHKTVQVPNIVLNSQWVENITRSKAMREQLILTVDFGTSFGDIQLLKREMQKFVRTKENSRDFQPDVDVEVTGFGEMNKLELTIEIRHKSNWHNETVRASRRSKFLCALVLAIRKVPIYGPGGGDAGLGDVGNPSYSVSISHEQAQAGRDIFSQNKEKSRMIPTDRVDEELATEIPGGKPTNATGSQESNTGNSTGLHYRGAAGTTKYNEEAFADALNTRPAALDQSRMDESDILRSNDESAPLVRGSSAGKRKGNDATVIVSPNTPITEEAQPSSRPPVDYYEYSTPFSQPPGSLSGRESPYQSNNPYVQASSNSAQQQRHQSGTPPPRTQSPSSRRPLPPGNAFAQQYPPHHPPH